MDELREIELQEEFIVLAIPENTVEVTISAKVWHDGEVLSVERTMPFQEVREAMKEAREGYMPSNAVFTFNPNPPKDKVERLLRKYCDGADDGYES